MEGKKKLSLELYRRFHSMKTYGKEAESLDSIIDTFVSDLAEFPISEIMEAIKSYALRNPEFPCTSDIYNILNPLPEKKDKAVFISLCQQRKDGIYLTLGERKYISDYEQQ